ncbi:hypothetical protein NliqN6_1892 [Naganishia liquefaciens]|uniref:triacylglycerol lipase n=1 Tax=Naganishia liquefaciens TaxID=104408 RepID=A0A8H3TQR9_9TREE|nr:hypothetical protein NliqN6_1892 [Naganishia liquefaciens]
MYLPPLIARLLPLLATTSPPSLSTSVTSTVKTFKPVKAHANQPDTSALLWHDASAAHSLQDMRAFDLEAGEAIHALNNGESIDPPPLVLRTRRIPIMRPRLVPSAAHLCNLTFSQRSSLLSATMEWEETEVEAPDTTDRETLRTLAMMSSNAYIEPNSTDWYSLDKWNISTPFGWEKDADGLRGHIFADETNSTVVISIKGTSAGVLGSGGPTAKNDKFNDNLLFSCCCARVDFSWTPVCDCYAGGYKCEQTCLEKALIGESVYTAVGTNLYNNVSFMYPNANIWLTGHSLGGALSSLIGLSFGAPVVAFESPADRLAAQRLHLPLPPGLPMEKMGVTHVYHNADPIPMGVCTGVYSGCYAAGFAIETRCHIGESILYDTVGKKGWSVDVRTHRITEIINRVLNEDWDDSSSDEDQLGEEGTTSASSWKFWGWPGKGPRRRGPGGSEGGNDESPPKKKNPHAVPKAETEDDCVDCFRWEFGDGYKKEPPTTTIATNAGASRTSA